MSLMVQRNEDESWRECVERVAGKYGLGAECLSIFDDEVSGGKDPGDAAWGALYEWDCLEYVKGPTSAPASSPT
jgi:hypothetical protein